MSSNLQPVLVIGGSGVVGFQAARMIRRLHPNQPLMIGGRDLAKAEKAAADLGDAAAVSVDLASPGLGLPEGAAPSAVIVFVKDDTLNSLRWAQARRLPFVSLSSGTFEIGPEVAQFIHAPASSPVLMASQWLAGAATLLTLFFARRYAALETIRIGLLLDEQDMGGPAAYADFERITGSSPAVLILEQGRFRWITGEEAKARYVSVDGADLDATGYSPLDIGSLAAATPARSIRIDLAYAESASRRRGGPFSSEIVIELEGVLEFGERARQRHEIVHPAGQAPLTALGVALGVERLLGLDGRAAPVPGLYSPESLIGLDRYMDQLRAIGTTVASR